MRVNPQAEELLELWFGNELDDPAALEERVALWFSTDAGFDETLRERFGGLPDRARDGDLTTWRDHPRSALALVMCLDQLPRNLFRGTPGAFAYDSSALEAMRWALDRKFDRELHPVQTLFFYMPLEHAEDLGLQEESVERFSSLAKRVPAPLYEHFASNISFAERHREVIRRFGRFPHRNDVLGRTSSPEELEYLVEGGERFGVDDHSVSTP